jgi:hypothetical protein
MPFTPFEHRLKVGQPLLPLGRDLKGKFEPAIQRLNISYSTWFNRLPPRVCLPISRDDLEQFLEVDPSG